MKTIPKSSKEKQAYLHVSVNKFPAPWSLFEVDYAKLFTV